LYFLRPLVRLALALTWIASGIVGLLQTGPTAASILAGVGLAGTAGSVALWATCLLDIVIGAALMVRWRPALLAVMQLILVIGYTAGLTYARPALWFDPFGPLLKNLPIMATILILAV